MENLFDTLNTAVRKRRAYNRTIAELNAMTLSTALDLDIYHGDIRKLARSVVYGK